MFHTIISLFSQEKCFGCAQPGYFFCPSCYKKLHIYSPYCYVCKKTSPNFSVHEDCQKLFPLNQVIVLTRYRQSSIKKLLRHAKYYNKFSSYCDVIKPSQEFFWKYIQLENSYLIPVPMHFLRRWKRWYNQSEKIAQTLSKISGIPVNNKLVKRSKYTPQQSHLSAKERSQNLVWAFKIHNSNIDKKSTIYLIDDIISTGSTIAEIALLLKKEGFTDVRAICLASD